MSSLRLPSEESSLLQKWKNLNLNASKKLGQHFLYDSKIVDKILKDEEIEGKTILEIGPGPGLLTEAILARNPKKLIALEKDPRFIEFLANHFANYGSRFILIEGDAVSMALSQISSEPMKIIANLPYNVSIKLLVSWLGEIHLVEDMVLMFQKEVADRVQAKTSTKAYGSLSILTQLICAVQTKFILPPGAFFPPPKVHSSVIKLTPRTSLLYPVEQRKLEYLCQGLFQTRRKMLRNSLRKFFTDPELIMQSLDINPTCRPEDLSIEEFCKLASYLPD